MFPSSRTTFRPLIASLLCVAVMGACASVTESNSRIGNYGSITISGKPIPGNRVSASVQAVFFQGRSATAPNSALQQGDQCAYAFLDTVKTGATGSLKVGESLALTFAGTTVNMPFSQTLSRYEPVVGATLSYTVGDAASVRVPGAPGAFPASTISVQLAEPIIPGPISLPATGAPMDVTWNGTNDATAAVILSVRYGATPTATVPNEQIYCALKDDGSFQLPASGLVPFLASPSALRSVALVRWRTQEVRPDTLSLLHIVSTVDTSVRFP